MSIVAWHNEPKLKQAAMARLREHRRLDQMAQKVYFEGGRGCHLGCLTHCNDGAHSATERMFGIEERIAYWLEAVFEGLPADKCADWVIVSTEAIPVGADLSLCHHHLAYWLLGPESPSAEGNGVAAVRELHGVAMGGGGWDESAAESARSAAESAARSAAWSAAESARSAAWSAESAARSAAESAESAAWSAESAARSAAESAAESAARSAAWSAARSAARSAAWSAAWEAIAAKSIAIFKAAPIVGCDEGCEESAAVAIQQLQNPVKVTVGVD